jgi:hypothetical protein
MKWQLLSSTEWISVAIFAVLGLPQIQNKFGGFDENLKPRIAEIDENFASFILCICDQY